MRFTAVYQQVPEGGYVAGVEELPGAMMQGDSLEEAREMLAEAVARVIGTNRGLAAEYAAGGTLIREPLQVTI